MKNVSVYFVRTGRFASQICAGLGGVWWLFALAVLFVLSSCSSAPVNPVAPSTSIPLPTNEDLMGIEVLSPDQSGYVVLQGDQDVIPDESDLIVTVLSADDDTFEGPEFTEESCDEVVPLCPSLSQDQQCRYEKQDQSLFWFKVPAVLSDRLVLSYQDREDCSPDKVVTEVEVDVEPVFITDTELEILIRDPETSSIETELGLVVETKKYPPLSTSRVTEKLSFKNLGQMVLLKSVDTHNEVKTELRGDRVVVESSTLETKSVTFKESPGTRDANTDLRRNKRDFLKNRLLERGSLKPL